MRKLGFSSLLLFATGLAAMPASAATINGPTGGDGGTSFVDRCPAPTYLVGFRFRTGALIDAIQPLCATFDRKAGQFGEFGEGKGGVGFHGGNTGGDKVASCPRDSYLSAIRVGNTVETGTIGDAWVPKYVDFVEIHCTYIATSGEFVRCVAGADGCYARRVSTGSSDIGNAPPRHDCQEYGEVAVGIVGRSGGYLDALGLMCDSGAADVMPALAAAARFCDDYAREAVIAATQSRDLGCLKNTGERWSLAPSEHLNWCRDFNEGRIDTANFETQARKDGLAACRFEITKPNAQVEPGASISDTLEAMKPPEKAGVENKGDSVSDVLKQTTPANKTGVLDDGSRISSALGTQQPGQATVPSVQPAASGYFISCRGGGGMSAKIVNGIARVRFAPAPKGFADGDLRDGECTWRDRAFRQGEPLVLVYARKPGDDKIVADLVKAAKDGGLFQAHVNNDGDGGLLVASLDRVETFPDTKPASSASLPAAEPNGSVTAVVARGVNVRDGCDSHGKNCHKHVVGRLNAGVQVAISGCDKFWCGVKTNVPGGIGFVSREFLKFGTAALPPANQNQSGPVVASTNDADNPDNPSPAPAGIDISGTWDTHTDKGWQYTIVLFMASGGRVIGTYTAQDGSKATLAGRLKGNQFSFNWATAPVATYKGTGNFTFAGDSFAGVYGTTEYPDNTNPAILTGTWTGTRQ